MKHPTYTFRILTLLCLIIQLLSACRKLVEVDPPVTNPTDETVFQKNATAAAVLTGIYSRMIQNEAGFSSGNRSISLLGGLSADELRNYSSNSYYAQFYINLVSPNSAPFWSELYKYIYTANVALEGLSTSTGVTSELKQQLTGEAYFIRGFCYFYLANLYGDVPLHTVTDYNVTSKANRSSVADCYSQIIADLKAAQELLSEDYMGPDNLPTSERIRPNKKAATAMLARVYLYTNKYAEAETEATKLINDAVTFTLAQNLDEAFLMTSQEAIWQLIPVSPQGNTYDARYFVLAGKPGRTQPSAISDQLLGAFEENDARMQHWVGSYDDAGTVYYFPFKYKIASAGQPLAEYVMVLRLAEQYLLRAEARMELGDANGALEDINVIRSRAGLDPLQLSDKDQILAAILHERQVELFTEWGHRWLDLKRTGKVNEVMPAVTAQKGGSWNPNWQYYPIPTAEIQNNPNIRQNDGY